MFNVATTELPCRLILQPYNVPTYDAKTL